MKKQNLWWTILLLMMFVSLGTLQAQTTYETLFISKNDWFNEMRRAKSFLSPNPAGWKTSRNLDDDVIYVGEVSNGVPNGLGRMTNPDYSTSYVGEWKDALFDGQGTWTFSFGGKYVGEHKNNALHGKGIMTRPDGHEFKGIWIDGEIVGKQFED